MTQTTPYIYKFFIRELNSQNEGEIKNFLSQYHPVHIDVNVQKQVIRVVANNPLQTEELMTKAKEKNWTFENVDSAVNSDSISSELQKMSVAIEGMTCRSCEITVERQWKTIPGVKKVEVNASTGKAKIKYEGNTPTFQQLQQALGDTHYRVVTSESTKTELLASSEKPTVWRLIGLFALVFLIGTLLSRLGLFKANLTVYQASSFVAVFLVGLLAASSSCIAVVGGLLLSSAAKFNERYQNATRAAKMKPIALFVAGRIVSYTLLGGLLGLVGDVLSPSPLVTALITGVAALYMLVMGLEMLHVAPKWLERVLPGTSKTLSHKIIDAEEKKHPFMPFLLGGATFFLPCGFTQALQLYALTTGSFTGGATSLLAFALGTAPALLALGFASSSLKGKTGKWFFQFSGALVIVLGLWNIQNAFSLAGYPLSLSRFISQQNTVTKSSIDISPSNKEIQVIKMNVDPYEGYVPDKFTLEVGRPVRWEVDGTNAGGCANVLVSRKFGIQKVLKPGINVIAFTPKEAGTFTFSCSMGMYRGTFQVVPSQS